MSLSLLLSLTHRLCLRSPFVCISDIEWKVIYVGSAEDQRQDQELDAVLLPADNTGRFMFVLEVEAPDPKLIPPNDLVGVTIILLSCSYLNKEFVRVGYYVSNEYPTPEMNENPPTTPDVSQLKRTVASTDPRVTKFPHKFDFAASPSEPVPDPELSADASGFATNSGEEVNVA